MRDFLAARMGERSTTLGLGMLVAGFTGLPPEQGTQIAEGVTQLTAALHSLSPLAPLVGGVLAVLWPTSGGRGQ